MGGNGDTEYRFTGAVVADNVFTDIGRSQPTTRTLSWYIDIIDNDDAELRGNLLVNQPDLGNSRGIFLSGGSNRGIAVRDNFVHGLRRRHLQVEALSAWSSILVDANTFVGNTADECLISHAGGFSNVTYSGNAYRSAAAPGAWFCVDGARRDLAGWTAASSESSAATADPTTPEPTRNLDSYAVQLGLGGTLADFARAARTQSRHTFRPELMAVNANNYIREGFGRPLR